MLTGILSINITLLELRKSENWMGMDSTQVPFQQIVTHQDMFDRHFNYSYVQTMLFHWPVSCCSSENISRSSHTARPCCDLGCTSREILNTTDIFLTGAWDKSVQAIIRVHCFYGTT